jgi:hypothetical protein
VFLFEKVSLSFSVRACSLLYDRRGGGSPRGAAPGGRSRATGGSTWHSTGIRAVAQGQGMNSREVQTEAPTQDNLAKTPM